MNRFAFSAGLDVLAAGWPQYHLKPSTTDAYWLVLHELDEAVFRLAVAECLKTCTFFPSASEIRAKAEQALNDAGLLPTDPETAWSELIAALVAYHPDTGWLGHVSVGLRLGGAPSQLPPLVEQAVTAVGGMNRIWNADDKELGFIRRDFLAFYGQKREQEMRISARLLAQPLPGRLALQHAKEGVGPA